MTNDLDETLNELGPAYRKVVARLKAAPEVGPRTSQQVFPPLAPYFGRMAASVAVALLLAAVTIGGIVRFAPDASDARDVPGVRAKTVSPYLLAYEASEAAVAELVRTQEADGSWGSDFLTRQNAAALRDVAQADVAYRRAVRYLRSRGLSPLTPEEFRARCGKA